VSRGARIAAGLVALVTGVIAVIGARPYAGGWNDGSRLAAAESLVDTGTWSIDASVFVTPSARPAGASTPYDARDAGVMASGTLDRMFIDGRFLSDKPPVSNLLLAAPYWVLQRTTGLVARQDPARTAYALTVASSGIAYVAAVLSIFTIGWRLFGRVGPAAGVAISLALATCAAAYTRHVNAHAMLLGVLGVLFVLMDGAARRGLPVAAAIATGALAGMAYGLEAGMGPLVVVTMLGCTWAIARPRVAWVVAGAVPFVGLHHVLNWQLAHTLITPPSSIMANLTWPGSPFDPATITGRFAHPSFAQAVLYGFRLWLGQSGFLLHNLPLLVAPAAALHLLRRHEPFVERPVVLAALALTTATWAVYTAGSNNFSGMALSIRWFVPLLAPLYYVVAVHLRLARREWRPFAVLTAAGAGVAFDEWLVGPWTPFVPHIAQYLGLAVIAILVLWPRETDARRPRA